MAKAAWKGRKASSFKRVSGAQAGKVAVRVYVCKSCGIQHPPGKKPEVCMDRSCGGLAFSSFDSTGEAGRWATLQLMEGRGMISDLRRQVRFDLMAATKIAGRTVENKVATYIADFTYRQDGEEVIEDFKGALTDTAALKLKWMAAMGKPVKLTS